MFTKQRTPATSDDAARAAVIDAERDRAKVEAVARRARLLRERNGFGEAIAQAMGERRA